MTTQRAHHETIRCACLCGRRTKSPAKDGWLELFDWSVVSGDDPRPADAATLWFASARCCWRYGEQVIAADLCGQVSGEANERLAQGETAA